MARPKVPIALLLLAPVLLVVSGCASARLPAIDPSGRRIFLPNPNYTTYTNDNSFGRFFNRLSGGTRPSSPSSGPYEPALLNRHRGRIGSPLQTPDLGGTPAGGRNLFSRGPGLFSHRGANPFGIEPAFTPAPTPPLCGPDGLAPDGSPCYPVGSPTESSLAATLAAAPVGSGILPAGYSGTGLPAMAQLGPGVIINPSRLVAAVGQEVVVVGGVRSPSGVYRPNERVAWSLSQDSAGTIIDAAGREMVQERRLFGFLRRRSPSVCQGCGNCVESVTAARCDLLPRNPLDPSDDIYLSRGQSWVSLTSGSEGISYVTLSAPDLDCGGRRQQTASVIWVDAQWQFPPPKLSALDGTELVTDLMRQTTRQPIRDWIVRYTYLDGPEVNFDQNEAGKPIDVPTDSQGSALVTVFPVGTQEGTTRIAIQLIKPQSRPGEPPQILVGEGIGYVTWSQSEVSNPPREIPRRDPPRLPPLDQGPTSPPTDAFPPRTDVPDTSPPTRTPAPARDAELELRVDAQATTRLSDPTRFVVTVRDIGAVAARDVIVFADLPLDTRLVDSIPAPTGGTRDRPEWRLPPSGRIEARFQFTQPGRKSVSFVARGSNTGGVVSESGTTQVEEQNKLSLRVSDPVPFAVGVGDEVTFEVVVSNQSRQSIDVELVADYDSGLEPTVGTQNRADPTRGIRMDPFALPEGGSRPVPLRFRALQPGFQQHRVVARGSDGSTAEAVGSVQVSPARRPPSVDVSVNGSPQIVAGETSQYTVFIKNTGVSTLTGVRVIYQFNTDLIVDLATDGHEPNDFAIEWNEPAIAPEAGVTYDLQLRASTNPSGRQVQNIVRVLADGGLDEQRPIVVEILPRDSAVGALRQRSSSPGARGLETVPAALNAFAGTISASVEARTIDVRVNQPIEYVVTVKNDGPRSYRDLVVDLQVDPSMRFVSNPAGPPGIQSRTDAHGILRFSAIREIRPGEVLTYRAAALSRSAGIATLRARVDAVGLPRPVSADTQSTIEK